MSTRKFLKGVSLLTLLGVFILLGLSPVLVQAKAPDRTPWCSVMVERMPQMNYQPQHRNLHIWGERSGLHLRYRTSEPRQSTESHLIISTSMRGLPPAEWGLKGCRLMLVWESVSYDQPKTY